MRALAALLLILSVAAQGRELQQEDKILNGRDTERGRFPYIANLRFPYAGNTDVKLNEFVCTGVLIRPDIVLTTAWCVINSGVWPTVRLNSYETNGGPAEVREVVGAVWNADYTPADDDVQDDIALLMLSKPSGVRPVAIPASSPNPAVPIGTKLTIAGWGLTKSDPKAVAKNLMSASQLLLTQQRCTEKWSSGANPVQKGGWNSLKIICGAYSGHNKALCFGDSSAPLIRRGSHPSQDLVVGLGSQSDCRGSGTLGGSIFTNLAQYRSWITKGISILRRGGKGGAQWVTAYKKDFPPQPTCRAVGHRCDVAADPSQCCSGNCVVYTCMP